MDILDASALLAFIKKEKGFTAVRDRLAGAENKQAGSVFIHQINFIEAIYNCKKKFGEAKSIKIVADLQSPLLGIVNYMELDLALYASRLKATYDMALGDAMGLAFTKIMKGRFWTKDKELVQIGTKEKIEINFIG